MNTANLLNLEINNRKLSTSLDSNMKLLNDTFMDCPDINRKEVYLKDNTKGYFIYIEEMINTDLIERDFMTPILSMNYTEITSNSSVFNLSSTGINIYYDLRDIAANILLGSTIFILDGVNYAITCNIVKLNKREITESDVEKNVKGAHEGFVEVLNVNLSILRRRIKHNRLKFKIINLGTTTNQTAAIAYIDGIANPKLLNTLYNKVSSINSDGFMAIGPIQQVITDFKHSPFPQYLTTERPDKAEASLLEGKFVILLDGTPVTIIAPVDFFAFFQAQDDYSFNWILGSFIRVIRFFSALIAIFLPAIYIAITSFHYYMVPLNLLIPLAQSRFRVPFPPIIEALIMELIIEMLREASIRLPSYVGTTIGVVGGIVLGQAAVQAGIVSSLLIITVAATAIASYVVPNNDMGFAIRFVRFIFMLLASLFGIIGISVCSALLFAHLLILESLGQPYFQPIIPFKLKDLKDAIIRAPTYTLKNRPNIAKSIDSKRGKNNGKRT